MTMWAGTGAPESDDRRTRRRSRRVNAILAMTARVVAERGYHSTSIEEIAERLDLAKPTVYHYFDSKEKLVYETLQVCAEFVSSALSAVAKEPGTATERLRGLIRRQIELISIEYPEMSRLFLQPLDWPEPIAVAVREWQSEHDAYFRRVIAEGLSTGEFDLPHPALSRLCLHGAMSVVPSWITRHDESTSLDEAADLLMRLFVIESGSGPELVD